MNMLSGIVPVFKMHTYCLSLIVAFRIMAIYFRGTLHRSSMSQINMIKVTPSVEPCD